MDVPVFIPDQSQINQAHITRYRLWVNTEFDLKLADYQELWTWSVANFQVFWSSLFKFFSIEHNGTIDHVLSQYQMPGIHWFDGIDLNYAEHIFKGKKDSEIALIACNESEKSTLIQWGELKRQVSSLQAIFQQNNLHTGDRVAGYLNNIPEASASMLATVASGMVWTSASPDFGSAAVIDRFKQIEPRVLIAVTKYIYGGKQFDRLGEIKEICNAIPSIESLIVVGDEDLLDLQAELNVHIYLWKDLSMYSTPAVSYVRVPFNDPLWILYSSGTTGLPKAITHSHGGMLLEHYKYVYFHNDVKEGETYFWYSSTGWMMWNFLHASWLAGSKIVLYDGHTMFPFKDILWRIVKEYQVNHFGTSAPYIHACIKEDIQIHALPSLRSISSTGSPLSKEAYDWIYDQVPENVYLWSMSGGTDMCTAFIGGCPVWPIYRGEIQCRCLGVDLQVYDEEGMPLPIHHVGELVIKTPMPCMPVYFWNDIQGKKYLEAYFEKYEGVWRHGDWIEITVHHGLVIHGRSDATLKRHGVRIGTAEIYAACSLILPIIDSLIIHIEQKDSEPWMPLFVKLKEGIILSQELILEIKKCIREKCSPRHVPDEIIQVKDIPYTLSGKKMETLIKKIFQRKQTKDISTVGVIRNAECLSEYFDLVR